MASILRNQFYLVSGGSLTPGTLPTVSFSGTSGSTALLTAFFRVRSDTRQNIDTSPTPYLCPGSKYIIRVILPGDPNVYWLSPPSGLTSINGVDGMAESSAVTLCLTPSSAVYFIPGTEDSSLTSFNNFPATLQYQNVTDSARFQIQPRNDFALAGYTNEIPILLSNCSACGCSGNQTCSQTGECQNGVKPCTPNSICGANNGTCPGICAASNGLVADCQLVGTQYTCVPSQRASSWTQLAWYILIGILGLIFLIMVLLVLYRLFVPVQVVDPLIQTGSYWEQRNGQWVLVKTVERPAVIQTSETQFNNLALGPV